MANYSKTVDVHQFSYTPGTLPFIFLSTQHSMKLVWTPTAEEHRTNELPQNGPLTLLSDYIIAIMSAKVNSAAHWSDKGPLDHNLEPANIHIDQMSAEHGLSV